MLRIKDVKNKIMHKFYYYRVPKQKLKEEIERDKRLFGLKPIVVVRGKDSTIIIYEGSLKSGVDYGKTIWWR